MPKQLQRGNAAKTVTLQVPLSTLHVRSLQTMLRDAPDTARLRGAVVQNGLTLHTQAGHDTVIKRLVSRKQIDVERDAVRAAMAAAAVNVTPERVKRLGSPAQRAKQVLQQASVETGRHDVKVVQVRAAVALLAGGNRTRPVRKSPVRTRSSRLAKPGASALPAGTGARRVLLHKFSMDSEANSRLAALLVQPGDKVESIASCVVLFQSVALMWTVKEMYGANRDHQQSMRQLRTQTDGELLRLFISRWTRAKATDRISLTLFSWFDAVDWLAGGLRDAKPPRPGDTRSPRSPRIVSPAKAVPAPATPLRVSKPVATPKRTVSSHSALTERRAALPRRVTVATTHSRPIFRRPGHSLTSQQKAVSPRAWPRPVVAGSGRHAAGQHRRNQSASPIRLVGKPMGPALPPVVVAVAAPQSGTAAPAAVKHAHASPPLVAQPVPPRRAETLLEQALQYQATLACGNDADQSGADTIEDSASS